MGQILHCPLRDVLLHPLTLCVMNLKPNMITLNGAAQGWPSGRCCCLGTSILPLTMLQSLLWDFLSFLFLHLIDWILGLRSVCTFRMGVIVFVAIGLLMYTYRNACNKGSESPKSSYKDGYITLPIRTTESCQTGWLMYHYSDFQSIGFREVSSWKIK